MERAVEMGIEKGKIRLRLNDAESTNGAIGHSGMSDTYRLTISKKILRDYEATKATRERLGDKGSKWWVSSEVSGTFSHEIGHAMVWERLRKDCGNNKAVLGYRSRFGEQANDRVAKLIVANAIDNLSVDRVALKENADKKYMSQYGAVNAHEMVAESFCNKNYSVLTREIYRVAREGLTGKFKEQMDTMIKNIQEIVG